MKQYHSFSLNFMNLMTFFKDIWEFMMILKIEWRLLFITNVSELNKIKALTLINS